MTWGVATATPFFVPPNLSPVRRNASLLTSDASLLMSNVSLLTSNASLLTSNASLLMSNASLLMSNASLLTSNASLLTSNASLLTSSASLLMSNASLLASNASLHGGNGALHPCNGALHKRNAALHRSNPALHKGNGAFHLCNEALRRRNSALRQGNGAFRRCDGSLLRCCAEHSSGVSEATVICLASAEGLGEPAESPGLQSSLLGDPSLGPRASGSLPQLPGDERAHVAQRLGAGGHQESRQGLRRADEVCDQSRSSSCSLRTSPERNPYTERSRITAWSRTDAGSSPAVRLSMRPISSQVGPVGRPSCW